MTDSNRQPGRHRQLDAARPGVDGQAAQTNEQPTWRTTTTPEEHEDFPGQMLVTRPEDHHGVGTATRAVPAVVRRPGSDDRLDELRLDIRGVSPAGK